MHRRGVRTSLSQGLLCLASSSQTKKLSAQSSSFFCFALALPSGVWPLPNLPTSSSISILTTLLQMDQAESSVRVLKLDFFPPEILAIVCGFLTTMQKLMLWQSGDMVLRYKMSTQRVLLSVSVSCNRPTGIPAQFASFLQSWTALKELKLRTYPHQTSYEVLQYPDWDMKCIPKGLERLFWSSLSDCGFSLQKHPLGQHFTALKSLYLHTLNEVTIEGIQMPPSLTELSIRMAYSKFLSTSLQWVPKTIQRLIIRGEAYVASHSHRVSLGDLFPQLQYLELTVPWTSHITSLPASLHKLSIYLQEASQFKLVTSLLPPKLRSLKFSGPHPIKVTSKLTGELPSTLEYFKVSKMASISQDAVQKLPCGLKMLYPYTPVSALPLLPLSMAVHLYSIQTLTNASITDLRIDVISQRDIPPNFAFPPALTRLSLDWAEGSVSEVIIRALPNGLRELSASATVVVPSAHLLPISLTSLRVINRDLTPSFLESVAKLPNLTALIQEQCLHQGIGASALAFLEHTAIRTLQLFVSGTFTSDTVKQLPRSAHQCIFICKFSSPARSDFGVESFSLLPPFIAHVSFPTFAANRKPLSEIECCITELPYLETINETHPNIAEPNPLWVRPSTQQQLAPNTFHRREKKLPYGVLDFDVRSEAKRSGVACITVMD